MKIVLILSIILSAPLHAQTFHKDVLLPGESTTMTLAMRAPSPSLTPVEMALVRQRIARRASREECAPFPCVMGAFTTYTCDDGYAMINQWHGVIASSIEDGTGTLIDVWNQEKHLPVCQNVSDWKAVLLKHRGLLSTPIARK